MSRASLLVLVSVCACGPTVGTDETLPSCDPWETACTVDLSPDFGRSVRLELPTARTEDTTEAQGLGGDEVLSGKSRYLTLGASAGGAELCLLDTYDDLASVDVDPDACVCDMLTGCWGSIIYFGLLGDPADQYLGRGILIRTADDELYRARVLRENPSSESAELTLEYEGVG